MKKRSVKLLQEIATSYQTFDEIEVMGSKDLDRVHLKLNDSKGRPDDSYPPNISFHKDDLNQLIQMLKGFSLDLDGRHPKSVKPLSSTVRVRVEITAQVHKAARKRRREDRTKKYKHKSATFYDTTPEKLLKLILRKLPIGKIAQKGKNNQDKPYHYSRISVYQIHGLKSGETNARRSGHVSITAYWNAEKVAERVLTGLVSSDKLNYK